MESVNGLMHWLLHCASLARQLVWQFPLAQTCPGGQTAYELAEQLEFAPQKFRLDIGSTQVGVPLTLQFTSPVWHESTQPPSEQIWPAMHVV